MIDPLKGNSRACRRVIGIKVSRPHRLTASNICDLSVHNFPTYSCCSSCLTRELRGLSATRTYAEHQSMVQTWQVTQTVSFPKLLFSGCAPKFSDAIVELHGDI